MNQRILLVSPPFTQLNTPYPATAYLKGFLNTQGIESAQMDLGIETILRLFSKNGLNKLLAVAKDKLDDASDNSLRIYALRERYISTIEAVISFLQDDDPTLGHFICERNFLPEASKFEQAEDLEWAFGTMGIRDRARHLATLYLEDISDFIVELIDPHFGFSRYAERLGLSARSFDELYTELNSETSFISELMLAVLKEKVEAENPTLVCLSVPFPGNLFAAFKCGQWLKLHYPKITVAMGGGFPNTELRSLSDPRVFEFVDFITLDDGETPLVELLSHLEGHLEKDRLKRTFALVDGEVNYLNGSIKPDIRQEKVGTPDYTGLPLKKYLSVIQLTNPMHRLWSDGRWNKLTMAHGCYWGKCTFCDISLDYIRNYEGSSATLTVDRMEELIAQTGERGFHFVDEAAPPALMKAIALEILKRKLVVTWWANIRFEKSFNYDLCRLLAASGCIAVSGGLEVASDRLLKLIAKGVTVEQVAKVNDNFNRAGIMVHAYLMYGFPTQTAQETIDSLEVVRQLFETNVLQSAFWHRFAMTAHSPVGMEPEKFKVKIVGETLGSFANNDLRHEDPTGANHDLFGEGLKKSLFNFMHGTGFDLPLQDWFDTEVPNTNLPPNLIESYLAEQDDREIKSTHALVWIGGPVWFNEEDMVLNIEASKETVRFECEELEGKWLEAILTAMSASRGEQFTLPTLKQHFDAFGMEDFEGLWADGLLEELREIGLLVI
ncbi:MAG: hypothetical protein RL266_2413 [Bacteroidota bacterium]|jgi:hypothetical protein